LKLKVFPQLALSTIEQLDAVPENDETLLRLAHPQIYADFLADWQRLAAHPLTQ